MKKYLCHACQEIEAPAPDFYCESCDLIIAGGQLEGYRLRIKRAERNIDAANRRLNQIQVEIDRTKGHEQRKNLTAAVLDCRVYIAKQKGIIDWCRHRLTPAAPAKLSLKEERKRLGLTQHELADDFHCSVQYIRKMESGERPLSKRARTWLEVLQKSAARTRT